MKKNLIYALVIITTATAFFLKANHNTQSVISDTQTWMEEENA